MHLSPRATLYRNAMATFVKHTRLKEPYVVVFSLIDFEYITALQWIESKKVIWLYQIALMKVITIVLCRKRKEVQGIFSVMYIYLIPYQITL